MNNNNNNNENTIKNALNQLDKLSQDLDGMRIILSTSNNKGKEMEGELFSYLY